MAILAIADTYGLEVVAEGIETAQQADVLRSLGCQLGQGYHYGRPVPPDQFSRLLELEKLPERT
jgi:EAL domain-containing protein (putative c-di-GMP-specific phosphodiesterase class I)